MHDFMNKLSFYALWSCTLPLLFSVVYWLGTAYFGVQEIPSVEISLVLLLYVWFSVIGLYLGWIPKLTWKKQGTSRSTKILYYCFFPLLSVLILIMASIIIVNDSGLITLPNEYIELLFFWVTIVIALEIILDLVAIIYHFHPSLECQECGEIMTPPAKIILKVMALFSMIEAKLRDRYRQRFNWPDDEYKCQNCGDYEVIPIESAPKEILEFHKGNLPFSMPQRLQKIDEIEYRFFTWAVFFFGLFAVGLGYYSNLLAISGLILSLEHIVAASTE